MNLVIGNTAQLSNYFPEDYEKISSYNINEEYVMSKKWDAIYFLMADSRTFIQNSEEFFDVNVKQSLKLIEKFRTVCDKLVWYSTADLWNNHSGVYDIDTSRNFKPCDYLFSKYDLTATLKNKEKYPNVVILYPVNFNSIYRKPGYLFYNIFQSIKNKTKVEVKNLNFHREFVHPRYVVTRSIAATQDEIIGSGRLTYIKDFVETLYSRLGMNYTDYINNLNEPIIHNKLYVTSVSTDYTTNRLIEDTLKDFK